MFSLTLSTLLERQYCLWNVQFTWTKSWRSWKQQSLKKTICKITFVWWLSISFVCIVPTPTTHNKIFNYLLFGKRSFWCDISGRSCPWILSHSSDKKKVWSYRELRSCVWSSCWSWKTFSHIRHTDTSFLCHELLSRAFLVYKLEEILFHNLSRKTSQ